VPYDKHSTPQLQVAESFEVSKRNLKTDYVDCFILHSPMATHAQTMQAWRAMERIHAAGGTRQLGISNCYDINVLKALYNDADVKPVVIQNRFYKDTGYDADLRQWCAEHRMIYQSFWTLTANKHVLDSDTVQKLARQYGKTEAQLFFRFLHQCGIVPLTGTCSAQHMREDLDIFEFELSVDELADVNRLLT
jgi:diketogulonate reductase-like aldo/keto reductase